MVCRCLHDRSCASRHATSVSKSCMAAQYAFGQRSTYLCTTCPAIPGAGYFDGRWTGRYYSGAGERVSRMLVNVESHSSVCCPVRQAASHSSSRLTVYQTSQTSRRPILNKATPLSIRPIALCHFLRALSIRLSRPRLALSTGHPTKYTISLCDTPFMATSCSDQSTNSHRLDTKPRSRLVGAFLVRSQHLSSAWLPAVVRSGACRSQRWSTIPDSA